MIARDFECIDCEAKGSIAVEDGVWTYTITVCPCCGCELPDEEESDDE